MHFVWWKTFTSADKILLEGVTRKRDVDSCVTERPESHSLSELYNWQSEWSIMINACYKLIIKSLHITKPNVTLNNKLRTTNFPLPNCDISVTKQAQTLRHYTTYFHQIQKASQVFVPCLWLWAPTPSASDQVNIRYIYNCCPWIFHEQCMCINTYC